MTCINAVRRNNAASLAIIIALALLVSACFLSPGKFTSTLDVRKDGRFTFTYVGEMYYLSSNEIEKNAGIKSTEQEFEPTPCFKPNGKERVCEPEEREQQKLEWEEALASATSEQSEEESNDALVRPHDLSDPEKGAEFARMLERQNGWRRVTYKGNGVFDVDYAITGTLNHDFTFPVIEQLPVAAPFVKVILRKDGSVRVDAPAYVATSANNPFRNLGAMTGAEAAIPSNRSSTFPVKADGTFSVTTNTPILANNTDEGSQKTATGEQLIWKVNDNAVNAPMALLRLTR